MLVSGGGVEGCYRKIHLFNREKLWFSPGDQTPPVFDIGWCRVGLMICFDWIFPETARTLAIAGADLIAHPSNLVLPYCQNAMVTRCLENRLFAVTANRIGCERRGSDEFCFTGSSQITGPKGGILHRATEEDAEVAVMEIDPKSSREKTLNPHNHLLEDRRIDLYGLSG
jgi:predicted amidohydrolase